MQAHSIDRVGFVLPTPCLLSTCSYNWPIIRDLVDDIVCVEEQDIANCTRLVWERMKLVLYLSYQIGNMAVLGVHDVCMLPEWLHTVYNMVLVFAPLVVGH